MSEPVVADSTCLIALERINALEILPAVFQRVLIPPEVEREFGVSRPWLAVALPTNGALVNSLKMLVDDGEAEAIALANQFGATVILDDRRARAVAKQLNVRIIGTLGCALRAKQAGAVASVKVLVESLEAHGFYLGAALKSEALRLAGE